MNNSNKILKVAVFANTGIGNEVFKSLMNQKSVYIDSVVTKKYKNKFPYFKESQLDFEVKKNNIRCFYDNNLEDYLTYIEDRHLDLIIVATFNKILNDTLLCIPKLGVINFHPSLLPKYRGPSPINWVLLNNEKSTGITIHKMTQTLDNGPIILQKEIVINENDCLGSLYKKLALLSGELSKNLIDIILSGEIKYIDQDELSASYYKRPTNQRLITQEMSFHKIVTILKAFHPFPGALFQNNDNLFVVDKFYFSEDKIKGLLDKNIFKIPKDEGDIWLFLK